MEKYQVWFGVRDKSQKENDVLMRIGDTILYYEKVFIGNIKNRKDAIRKISNYYTPDVVIVEMATSEVIFMRESGKDLMD